MKFKKFISSSLAIGLLLNSTSISLASILSEDGRYETFEGNNITIPDVLEEDKVDVEIEGNTMVNVANQKDSVPITKKYTVEGSNHIPLQGEYDGKARPVIEGNTMYYNNDTGEYFDTFVEGANLSLVSSFEDQLVTQEMIDNGQEKAENLGKYKVEYKITGKNKFDGRYIDAGFILSSDGSANKVSFSSDWRTYYIECKPNTTYYIKGENAGNRFSVGTSTKISYTDTFTLESYAYIEDGSSLNERTITTTDKSKYLLVYVTNNGNFVENPKITISESSIATEYEPYKESIKTFYLNSPLLEGDTIEDVDGKATHVKRSKLIELNGNENENWSLYNSGYSTGKWFGYNNFVYGNDRFDVNKRIFSNRLKTIPYSNLDTGSSFGINLSFSIRLNTLEVDANNGATVEDLRLWLSNNPLKIVCEIKKPIYETISEESILCDSYTNGHLDLNSNIPVNKVDFIPTNTSLNYLYSSTEYTVQFKSNNIGKINKVLLGDNVLYSDYIVNKGINKFNITTPSTILSTELTLDGIGFNLSNLVVAQATDEVFDYFEGIKSVGQDDENGHKIEIITQNNLADIATEGDTNFEVAHLKAGKTYSWKSKRNDSSIGYNLWIRNEKGYTIQELKNNIYDNFYTFTAATDGILYHNGHRSMTVSEIMLVEGTYTIDTMPSYKPYVCDKKDILLTEPLRRLPNGVKDRIIKRNGQWVVERNCDEVVLDGNEKWGYYINMAGDARWCITIKNVKNIKDTIVSVVSDKLPAVTSLSTWNGEKEGICQNSMSNHICIYLKNFNKPEQLNDFKQWLSKNPIKVTYQLKDTVYEPINYSSLTLYNNTTHVSANSIVPANMKITVDRTLNRAVEHIELAKVNPTMANLSLARMWVNLINDSVLKDQLQNEVNSITNIDDLQLERKSASSNLDVYVKSQNMLSMSLNTNSVTFDGYSGTEDMEMLSAVNISINSSLPYSLNAYMSNEITNSDKSETMPIDILNIREESEGVYQTFANTTDKVVLKDNCSNGNDLIHNIDLKLSTNLAHKADVYKTVIKFEAEQK